MTQMNILTPKDWKIRRKVLTLAIIPLFLATSLLTGYFTWVRQTETEAFFLQKGSNMAQSLASASELYMFSGDTPALQSIAQAALKEQDTIAVSFLNPNGSLLGQAGPLSDKPSGFEPVEFQSGNWIFNHPIQYSSIEVDDFALSDEPTSENSPETQLLGWVRVIFSDSRLKHQQQVILLTGAGIAGAGLALALLMAASFSRSISRPLSKLSETVELLESGNLSARAPDLKGNEFKILAIGLNRMAKKVEQASVQQKQRIEEATKKLKTTMTDLEQRNRQLETTRNELILADQAKDEFLARMSHELRTPITSIMGYSRLIEKLGLHEQQLEFNQVIQQSSDLLLSVINDLLNYSKLRSNAIELEQRPFFLEECLENIIAMHAHSAFKKGLELVLLIESDVPTEVVGDSLRFSQIVNNLLSNAVKFTEQGEVVLFVSVSNVEGNQVLLNIRVKDSGIGLKPEDQQRLFTEFSQADSSITRRFGGSGLGLVIAKELAELMQGSLVLESTWQKGTEALCQITMAIDARSQNLPAIPQRDDKIIIYDQHPWALRELRHTVLKWTTHIVTVSNISELLTRLIHPEAEFSCIIIGLSKEETDSQELSSLLQQVRSVCTTPLLLAGATARLTLQENPSEWNKFPSIDFISKPHRSKIFIEKLSALIFGIARQNHSRLTAEPVAGIGKRLNNKRVLIAEDNDFNRRLIAHLLVEAGATVIEASHGKEAVLAAESEQVDIFLLDLNMPELDGYSAARIIREKRKERPAPIIAISAIAPSAQSASEQLSLFDAVLTKPIDEQNFIDSLSKYCVQQDRSASDSNTSTQLFQVSEQALKEEVIRLASMIKKAASSRKTDQIRNYAHQLKGVIDPKLFSELSKLSLRLENITDGIGTHQIDTLMDELDHFTQQFKSES